MAEHFGTTLHKLLFAGRLDPEFISEVLVTYGKDLFFYLVELTTGLQKQSMGLYR